MHHFDADVEAIPFSKNTARFSYILVNVVIGDDLS